MDTALPFQLDNEHSFGALKKSGPLKITIVSETLPPDVNGVAMTMGKIIEGLWIAKHEITLVHPQSTQDNSNTTTLNRMTVRGVPIPFYSAMQFGMPALGRLHMQWTQQRPHLVHIVTEGPLGWSALQAAKKLGIPVVSSFHTNFHSYSKHYGFGVLEPAIMRYLRWFHNKANVTLVPTQELANALTIKGINNTVVLSRGVDTNQFSPAHRSQSLRACWGVSENDLIVIYVGRLAAEKNLDLTMDAFCEIKKQQPHAKMVLVGDGPLKQKMQDHPAEPIVCGNLTGHELARHYASADIFLFPSRSETFGNVTLEAMASGLAVVAFDYAAARQHIKNGNNGMLVSYESDEQLLKAATTLANQPELVEQMRARARTSILGQDWSNIQSRLMKIYSDSTTEELTNSVVYGQ